MVDIYAKPKNLAITQRQKTTSIKNDDGDKMFRTKITIECRNPVYRNMVDFMNYAFMLHSEGFILSKERHSPWYYPFRITMLRDVLDTTKEDRKKIIDEIASAESKTKKAPRKKKSQ